MGLWVIGTIFNDVRLEVDTSVIRSVEVFESFFFQIAVVLQNPPTERSLGMAE